MNKKFQGVILYLKYLIKMSVSMISDEQDN